jgi:DNA-binding GntR family transcriptional regulator
MSTKTASPRKPASVPRRGNLAVQVADQLRDAILRGDYAIGQPLRELELCRRFGVSRIPLREALHRLEGEGHVIIRPNRGASVAELAQSAVREIAEACRLLVAHVLRLAVPALRPEVLERAAACLDELDELDDPHEWSRVNWRFHTTLYSAADRPLLVELLGSLRARVERAMLILVAEKKRRAVLNLEHRAILACARAGSAAKAARLLDAHLKGGRDEVLRLIEPR